MKYVGIIAASECSNPRCTDSTIVIIRKMCESLSCSAIRGLPQNCCSTYSSLYVIGIESSHYLTYRLRILIVAKPLNSGLPNFIVRVFERL